MHELLLAGGGVVGGFIGLWWARIRWHRARRRAAFAIGDRLPSVPSMPSATGGRVSVVGRGHATVLVFMSNRCPGVKAYDARLRALHAAFAGTMNFVGVNAIDDRNWPDEDLRSMAQAATDRALPFPYLKDEGQVLARRLGAICTPHVFVLDAKRILRYRGRIDDALLEANAKKPYLRWALEAVAKGEKVGVPETAPLGCSIEFSTPTRPSPPKTRPEIVQASRP